MKRDMAMKLLRENQDRLRKLGVKHLYLFGSTVRNEARPNSDIDLFFDHDFGAIGLYELMDIKETATEILGGPADMIPRRGLHDMLRARIEESSVQVF
jgi:predicted nucleotidyltransferase